MIRCEDKQDSNTKESPESSHNIVTKTKDTHYSQFLKQRLLTTQYNM